MTITKLNVQIILLFKRFPTNLWIEKVKLWSTRVQSSVKISEAGKLRTQDAGYVCLKYNKNNIVTTKGAGHGLLVRVTLIAMDGKVARGTSCTEATLTPDEHVLPCLLE